MEYILIGIIIVAVVAYAFYVKKINLKDNYKENVLDEVRRMYQEYRQVVANDLANAYKLGNINHADMSVLRKENQALIKDMDSLTRKVNWIDANYVSTNTTESPITPS